MVSPNLDPKNQQLLDSVEALAREAFPEMPPEKPILGEIIDGKDVEIAPNLRALLERPTTILATLVNNDTLLGFSMAIPIGEMDPRRADESSDTAYVYFTTIDKEHQGQGLVGQLQRDMEQLLRDQGYKFLEEDVMVGNGYAASVVKHYGESIVHSYGHDKFKLGQQLAVRIDLSKLPA
ncbi:MAG TPA: GNAT family N-acetyltransferase [Candidatus Saccharimonadales bacterium]|nr:GNAT family N-acetyltransferase [Candidatus Saccharimonadales bacterium]